MKKIKFTFWLLGFGCGIALTGIIGTFISLHVHADSQQETKYEKAKEVETEGAATSEAETDKHLEIQPTPTEEVKKETPAASAAPSPTGQPIKEKEITYKKINIPRKESAAEICKLLEKNGLIEDADDFLTYVKAQGKQRFLKRGEIELPVGAEYEELLKQLSVS